MKQTSEASSPSKRIRHWLASSDEQNFCKVRWSAPGRGKLGGVRVIYYWWNADRLISMVLICAKNEKDDLTPDHLKKLRQLLD